MDVTSVMALAESEDRMDEQQFKIFMTQLKTSLDGVREADYYQLDNFITKMYNEAEKDLNNAKLTDPDQKFKSGRMSMIREVYNFLKAQDEYDT